MIQNNNSMYNKSTGTQKHDNSHVKSIKYTKMLIKIQLIH